jgi:uracil phosphoribosyltransferase
MIFKEASASAPVEIHKVSLNGYPVVIETAQEGAKIPILQRLDHPESYVGPREFEVVVNFKDLFVKKGLWKSRVPKAERWTPLTTPEGITILGFFDDDVQGAVDEIAWLAQRDFYDNEDDCSRYFTLNQDIFEKIAIRTHLRRNRIEFLGLIRAGVVAGEMLGIRQDEQILVQTKRLHLKGEAEGDIAIGITPEEPQRLAEIEGRHLLIADPAGATYSSVVGNLIYLNHLGIRPGKVSIWNTVASHKGSLFAMEAMKALGIDGEIFAGGYSPALTDRYYLETEKGTPSVRDAGDALDRFLPERLKLRGI